jgi:uncharacterized protein (TIGR02118 family)
MIKVILLIRRKPNITREEFVNHYEEVHAPLVLKHFPWIKGYVRNYVVEIPISEELGLDCITEYWYDSLDDAIRVQAFCDSEAGQVIIEDEEKFIDIESRIVLLGDERISEIEASS